MTDPTEDRVVEAMARSIAIARGENPESFWRTYALESRCLYRAYLAMQSVLMDLKPVQPVSETTVPLCDHPLVRRLMDWFSEPANGAFEREDFEAFMLDEGTTIYWKDVPGCGGAQGHLTAPLAPGATRVADASE